MVTVGRGSAQRCRTRRPPAPGLPRDLSDALGGPRRTASQRLLRSRRGWGGRAGVRLQRCLKGPPSDRHALCPACPHPCPWCLHPAVGPRRGARGGSPALSLTCEFTACEPTADSRFKGEPLTRPSLVICVTDMPPASSLRQFEAGQRPPSSRVPAQVRRVDVENAGSGDGGRRGGPQVADLEHQPHGAV